MVKKQEESESVIQNAKKILGGLLDKQLDDHESTIQGITNLNSIPPFETGSHPPAVKGKGFEKGIMGFKRRGKGELRLAVACGKAQVRYIPLGKYIAMVENLHDPDSATIMIQNFTDQEEYQSSKGQELARINPKSSAITFIQGVTGRIVRGPRDIALFDVYYIDRTDMMAFYLAAKAQISNADELEAMIQAYDGWKAFDIPLDPLHPYDHEK
jgi:hypothetical protein